MSIRTKRVVSRLGMSPEVPVMGIGEVGWDIDKKRFRVGDGTTTPPMVMTNKSTGGFEFNNIAYVQYPEIRMLPEGTVDGVDISDLNAANGLLVRRGNNLWAHRTIVGNPEFFSVVNGNGVAGNPTIDFTVEFKDRINNFLSVVYTDNETILGNGREENPLYARTATVDRTGVTETATEEEALAGTDTFRYLTPFTLKKWGEANASKNYHTGAVFASGLGNNGHSGTVDLGSRVAFFISADGGNFVINGNIRIGANPNAMIHVPPTVLTGAGTGTSPITGKVISVYLVFKKGDNWYLLNNHRAIYAFSGNSFWYDGENDAMGSVSNGTCYEAHEI